MSHFIIVHSNLNPKNYISMALYKFRKVKNSQVELTDFHFQLLNYYPRHKLGCMHHLIQILQESIQCIHSRNLHQVIEQLLKGVETLAA